MSSNIDVLLNAYPGTALYRTPKKTVSMIKFGVIGYGYWGPNVVRNLQGIPGAESCASATRVPLRGRDLTKPIPMFT